MTPHHEHARTVALVAILRHIGSVKRRHRIPRQKQPDALRLGYFNAIAPVCDDARRAFDEVRPQIVRAFAAYRAEIGRSDEDDNRNESTSEGAGQPPRSPPPAVAAAAEPTPRARSLMREALALIEQARGKWARMWRPREVHAVAAKFGERTADFNQAELDAQVRAAIGVQYESIERPTRDRVPAFAAENVDLIKTVPGRYFDRLSADVQDAYSGGLSIRAFTRSIEGRYDMARDDARRIARDQIGKLNAQVNEDRQKALGVTSYIWRSMRDNRTTEDCLALDGKRFRWDDPPEGGPPGEHHIQCFPGDEPVALLNSRVLKAYRRWYSGELTTLITDTGEPVRCTPNHPVLTGRGWLPAHLVDVGDHMFEAPAKGFDLRVANAQGRDPLFEQVFGAALELGIAHRVAGSASGFHGDGANEQVDVVDVDRCLGIELDPALSQGFCDDVLSLADSSGATEGDKYLLLFGLRDSGHRGVRGLGKLLALVGSQGGVPGEHGARAVARLHAIADELGTNGRAADAELFRKCLDALAAKMESGHEVARVILGVWRRAVGETASLDAPSAETLGEVVALAHVEAKRSGRFGDGHSLLQSPRRIVEKRVGETYTGHVFNLQTSSGWYVTHNLIVRNCRCYSEPDFSDLLASL